MWRGSLSPALYLHGGQSVDCAPQNREAHSGQTPAKKERLMDIIAIQIVATGALLVAHFAIVVRNRLNQR
jgi:hypothetical protein